jgi:HupF/HypC family
MSAVSTVRGERPRIEIQSAIQGMGFRPTVYRLGAGLRIAGKKYERHRRAQSGAAAGCIRPGKSRRGVNGMCLAIPGKIVMLVVEEHLGFRRGKVDFGGVRNEVCLDYTPEAKVGD